MSDLFKQADTTRYIMQMTALEATAKAVAIAELNRDAQKDQANNLDAPIGAAFANVIEVLTLPDYQRTATFAYTQHWTMKQHSHQDRCSCCLYD